MRNASREGLLIPTYALRVVEMDGLFSGHGPNFLDSAPLPTGPSSSYISVGLNHVGRTSSVCVYS